MIIPVKYLSETLENIKDALATEAILKEKIVEMKKANQKLSDTLDILIVRPPVTLATTPFVVGDYRVARYIRYSRYNLRGAMNIYRFIDFCDQDILVHKPDLSKDGERYILPLIPIFKSLKIYENCTINFPLNTSITTTEFNDYHPQPESRTNYYEKGIFEPSRLELFSERNKNAYRNEGNHQGITEYLPFWDRVKDLIKSNLPTALLESDLYITKINDINIRTQEILFPLYAKRALFTLELPKSIILTQDFQEKIIPMVNYALDYTKKINLLIENYKKILTRTEELFDVVIDGKMNLSTKPFEFPHTNVPLDQKTMFKIDGCIYEKTYYNRWTYIPRYGRISNNDFFKSFVPQWKDEYLPNIRFQYREIFKNVMAFAKTFVTLPKIQIEKTYEVEPCSFYIFPQSEPVQCGRSLTLTVNERSGLLLTNRLTDQLYNHSVDDYRYYSVIHTYKDQFDDLYIHTKKIFDEKSKIALDQKNALEEILTPFLIAKSLFLESNEQKNSR